MSTNNFKFSAYNHFVKLNEDKFIGFNFLSNSLIEVDLDTYNSITNYSLELLERENKQLVEILKNYRFIIEHNIVEIDIVKFRFLRDNFIDNSYRLTINPTMNCNFNCWYCYEKHSKSKMNSQVSESISKFVHNLLSAKKISKLVLSWFGGEPLLYFEDIMYPLAIDLKNQCNESNIDFKQNITTNGYLIKESYIDKFNEIGLNQFQITLDGYQDIHNKIRFTKDGQPSYNKIIKNINLLSSAIDNCDLSVRINYTSETFKNIHKIIDDISINNRKNITINLQKVWQIEARNNEFDKITTDAIHMFNDAGFKKTSQKTNFTDGSNCYANKWHSAVINFDGSVYKCTARDFNRENSDGCLKADGNIVWKPEKIFSRMTKIPFENNVCLECLMLPICMGLCSQKSVEIKTDLDIKKNCHYMYAGITPDIFVKNFYEKTKNKQSL